MSRRGASEVAHAWPVIQLTCRLLLPLALLTAAAACGGSAATETSTAPPSGASPAPAGRAPLLQGELTIFAAASLTGAFSEIKATLEATSAQPTITLNLAGSSQLRAQLAQGARADLFASADERTMEGAQRDGTVSGQPRIFARNRLVVVLPADNPAGIVDLADLARPGVKLVLTPEQVPVGGYARQALDRMSQDSAFGADFKRRVLANLVSEEANVRAALAKVQLGEADATIVYVSDVSAQAADGRGQIRAIEIPEHLNVEARYPIAVARSAPNRTAAEAFINYLLSPSGQEILVRYGFAPGSS